MLTRILGVTDTRYDRCSFNWICPGSLLEGLIQFGLECPKPLEEQLRPEPPIGWDDSQHCFFANELKRRIHMSNSYSDLEGRVVAITGGGGAIGNAFVTGLAAAGMKVAILDLDEGKAIAAATQLETEAIGLRCDVLDESSLKHVDGEIAKFLGDLDFLVNCAGGNHPAASTKADQIGAASEEISDSFFEIDLDGFRQTLDLNLLGTVLPCKILGRRIAERAGGAIVNISSMNAFRPLTRIPAYSAGKSAVTNFTEWLAVHLAPSKVRVNAIAPGFFITEQLRYLAFEQDGSLTPRYERVLANTPMRRFGEPEELVGTLLYLLSEGSRFVTGVVIPVDGGFNAFSGV